MHIENSVLRLGCSNPNKGSEETMFLAYTFGQVMWSMFVFFCWILFFWPEGTRLEEI